MLSVKLLMIFFSFFPKSIHNWGWVKVYSSSEASFRYFLLKKAQLLIQKTPSSNHEWMSFQKLIVVENALKRHKILAKQVIVTRDFTLNF